MDSMKFSIQTLTGAAIGCFLAALGAIVFGWQHNDVRFLGCVVAGVAITHLVGWHWASKAKALAAPRPRPLPEMHHHQRSRRPYDNS